MWIGGAGGGGRGSEVRRGVVLEGDSQVSRHFFSFFFFFGSRESSWQAEKNWEEGLIDSLT